LFTVKKFTSVLCLHQWQMDELRSSTRALVSTTADDHHLIIDTAYLSRIAAFNVRWPHQI